MMVKLEEIVAMVSRWCPNVLVLEEDDGNITLSLNMKLHENVYLVPFTDEYELAEEDS